MGGGASKPPAGSATKLQVTSFYDVQQDSQGSGDDGKAAAADPTDVGAPVAGTVADPPRAGPRLLDGKASDAPGPPSPTWRVAGMPTKEQLLAAALQDAASTVPREVFELGTDPLQHGLPPPPPEDKGATLRPQLRASQLRISHLQPSTGVYGPGGGPPLSPRRAAIRTQRLAEKSRQHASHTAKTATQLHTEELTFELVSAFREAMVATEKQLTLASIENAELLGLLKAQDNALLSTTTQTIENGQRNRATAAKFVAPVDSQSRGQGDLLSRLQGWRQQMVDLVRPRLNTQLQDGVLEDVEEQQTLTIIRQVLQRAAIADEEATRRLKAEAKLAAIPELKTEIKGTQIDAADESLHTKLSLTNLEMRRLQLRNRELEQAVEAARAEVHAIEDARKRAEARDGPRTRSSAEDNAVREKFEEQLKAQRSELLVIKNQLSAAQVEATAAGTLRLRIAELEAAVEERQVSMEMCQSMLAESRSRASDLEAELQKLHEAAETVNQTEKTPKTGGQAIASWKLPELDPGSHEQIMLLADRHAASGLEHSGQKIGLMQHSLQSQAQQLSALQRLYAAATAQADSARRQAEAAAALNEQLVHARSAPHHDANEDARRLIRALHDRIREQDQFISVSMKRLATLEAFVREERDLVVERAKEHVGVKLAESTRRFNVYARKAKEHEEHLRQQLMDATAETTRALSDSTAVEELRLVAERAAESEKKRKEHARQQLARCYKDGKRRDALYVAMICQLQANVQSLENLVESRKKQEAAAEQRALEAEKEVKRLEYNAKMVEIERKQENAWDLKISLKAKEEQIRALAKATTRLQALLHGPELKHPTFATQDERVDALISDCTAEASDIRGRELLSFEEERTELQGKIVSSTAEVMREARQMKANLEEQISKQKEAAKVAADVSAQALAASQQEATNRIAQLTEALRECGSQLEATREREDTSEHQLLCYRKIANRLVQYIGDKRKLLSSTEGGEQPYNAAELSDYAKYLGIEPTSTHLGWIAEEALHAPLPPHWSSHRDDVGDVYFYCTKLDKSTYEHPLDNYFRTLYKDLAGLYLGNSTED